jgi:hypothetical protein
MNELLVLYAEVAVGFTGFAAIVSALGVAPSGADMRLDRLRLRNLVEIGVTVVLTSMLPLLLQQTSGGDRWAWRLSAATLTAFVLVLFFIQVRRNRHADVSNLSGYSVVGSIAIYVMGIVGLGILILGQVAPALVSLEVAYATALFLMLAILGLYFVRIAASLLTHDLGMPPGTM